MTTTITEKEEVRKTLKSESKNTDGVTVVTMEASVTNMDYNTISYHVNIVNIAEYAKDKVILISQLLRSVTMRLLTSL